MNPAQVVHVLRLEAAAGRTAPAERDLRFLDLLALEFGEAAFERRQFLLDHRPAFRRACERGPHLSPEGGLFGFQGTALRGERHLAEFDGDLGQPLAKSIDVGVHGS